MGICFYKGQHAINASLLYNSNQISYPRKSSVELKKIDMQGRVIEKKILSFSNTEPILCISSDLSCNISMWGSACTLPGLDPSGKHIKKCQDLCFTYSNGQSTILGVFDGHGQNGELISDYCVKESKDIFITSMKNFTDRPTELLITILETIYEKLKDPTSTINIENSGCSCTLALVHNNYIHLANLGDARAVLGTFKETLSQISKTSAFIQEKDFLLEISKRRSTILQNEPNSLQLTIDHSTKNTKEMVRVLKSGGCLQQNFNKYGNRCGPYYIWKNYSNKPGIPISRCIGYTCAEDIGINSNPDVISEEITMDDEFLVVATKGVWDVMSNKDVVNFIAGYKDQAKKVEINDSIINDVNVDNSCIARLLCEEARVRWLALVENENCIIEDISCVILEFDCKSDRRTNAGIKMPMERVFTIDKGMKYSLLP
ncbi:hypothetical protein SteCoe_35660 [Stentor coeruleus]|uniref:protein-serine/threonine phosphatase n=1 Tax=Stentor coeruleus TaxID=5963 RepID=A0A1R2AS31_9CILI|nr:hypothetical protein SteCoe_35660 [Stentor coeruleus]